MEDQEKIAVDVKRELGRLTAEFFRAVSFAPGSKPVYAELYALFIDNALIIKNNLASPEITSVSQFIEPRQKAVDSGALTSFKEVEIAEITETFGNVAHRFSTYHPLIAAAVIAAPGYGFAFEPGGSTLSQMSAVKSFACDAARVNARSGRRCA